MSTADLPSKFALECTKPVAADSPDHLVPRGTKNDNSRNRLFNRKVELLLAKRPLRVLDFGCAGGGFVKDCIDDGHIAVGLEGSDYSKRIARAEWATIPQSLFTCDITSPFALSQRGSAAQFDLITGWEFMEHIPTPCIEAICANAEKHLAAGGLVIFSIADFPDEADGVVYHQTVQPKAWWVEKFRSLGFTNHENVVGYFGNDWIRGPYQGSRGFHVVLTRSKDNAPAIPSRELQITDLINNGVQFLDQGAKKNNSGGYSGNLEYALHCFDRAIAVKSCMEAHYGKAVTLIQLKRTNEAIVELQQADKLSPGNRDIARMIAQLQGAARPSPVAPRPAPAQPKLELRPVNLSQKFATMQNNPRKSGGGPKISVVTPTFNCGKYLRQCIESVLAQGYENFEHIIVDGASKDETVEILKSYPHVKWISEPDSGEAEALNKALKMATGDIINWLNADDYYNGAEVFRTVVAEFARQSDCDVLVGKALIINEDDNVLGMRTPKQPLNLASLVRWFRDIHLYQPSMFYTKKVAERVGPYRQDLFFSIDLEYWLRIAAAGFKYGYVDSALARARLVRSGAKSANDPITQEKNWQEIVTPFAKLLPPGEKYNYWKDYFDYRIANQKRYNESINAPADCEGMRALAAALMEKNEFQVAFNVVQQMLSQYPNEADGYWLASDILCRSGRPAEARHLVQEGLNAQRSRAVPGPKSRGEDAPAQLAGKIAGYSRVTPNLEVKGSLSRKALLFFPHNPIPPQSGAHQYFLSVLDGLRASGFRSTLVSSTQSSETQWTKEAIACLNQQWNTDVSLHQPTQEDQQYINQNINSSFGARLTSPGLHKTFREAFAHLKPEWIGINYAAYGPLATDAIFSTARRAIFMHDLVTANDSMQKRMWADLGNRYAGQFGVTDVPAHFIDETYFAQGSAYDPAEMQIYNQYDCTVSVSMREGNLVEQAAPATRVVYLPNVWEIDQRMTNSYSGDPLFAAGVNLFNVQGYLYFVAKILPHVLSKHAAFNLKVVGNACKWLKPAYGAQLTGFVDNIMALYQNAPFALCPLIGGTGQQVKIIEAMAAGVPVISMDAVAQSSPIEHGINGFVAKDAKEFADYVLRLYADRKLCRQMGEAARETIRAKHTIQSLPAKMRVITDEATLNARKVG
ncbi:MAG TPA: glycosyltransferase [Tepidisphaeraceae bacterium]